MAVDVPDDSYAIIVANVPDDGGDDNDEISFTKCTGGESGGDAFGNSVSGRKVYLVQYDDVNIGFN